MLDASLYTRLLVSRFSSLVCVETRRKDWLDPRSIHGTHIYKENNPLFNDAISLVFMGGGNIAMIVRSSVQLVLSVCSPSLQRYWVLTIGKHNLRYVTDLSLITSLACWRSLSIQSFAFMLGWICFQRRVYNTPWCPATSTWSIFLFVLYWLQWILSTRGCPDNSGRPAAYW